AHPSGFPSLLFFCAPRHESSPNARQPRSPSPSDTHGGAMSTAQAWAEAAFLGLVQGLTEFLPVSSSAHLRIIGPMLPSGGDPGAAFTAITQIGTEAAVLLYFRHDIVRIFLAWWRSLTPTAGPRDPDARMAWLIIV